MTVTSDGYAHEAETSPMVDAGPTTTAGSGSAGPQSESASLTPEVSQGPRATAAT